MARLQRLAAPRPLAAFASFAVLMLAACGAEEPAGPGVEVEFDPALYAGMWEQTSTITNAEMPGAPPDVAATMHGQVTTTSYCVTAEDMAERPATLFNLRAECAYDTFTMRDGRIEAAGSCAGPGGQGRMTLSGSGAYSATDYHATSLISMNFPGGEMRIEADTTGRRIGDC